MVAWKIASRYFVSKRNINLINVISRISVIGVAVGTMGLIIVLSVFNGFGNLVLEMYDSFDPDLKVVPLESKTFVLDSSAYQQMHKIQGIDGITLSLEENALLRYKDAQVIATVKGVDKEFFNTSLINKKIIEGNPVLDSSTTYFFLLGGQVAYSLGVRVNDPLYKVNVFMPKKSIDYNAAMLDPSSAFSQQAMAATGIFSVQQDFDSKYVIAPIAYVRDLLNEYNKVSAIEIKLSKNADQIFVIQEIKNALGNQIAVKDRFEQHDFLYKVLKSEKFGVYVILVFILIIATFNVFGSLTMLIVDKKKDIQILLNIGATQKLIKRIFLLEGLMISLVGAITGLLLGFITCFLQSKFSLIKLENSEGFITEAYPVAMQVNDFVIVFAIVFVIGFVASYLTSNNIVKKQMTTI